MRASELKKNEEAKRERNWNPQMRWKTVQATIAWADAQATVRRNTPTSARNEQARKRACPATEEQLEQKHNNRRA